MWFNETSDYLKGNKNITKDLVDFFFQKELDNLQRFQKFDWCPKLLDVDTTQNKILIEFNKATINYPFVQGGYDRLTELCPDWQEQIFAILSDIKSTGYFKMSLYPHCFFLDKRNRIKPIDFYACLPHDDAKIPKSKIQGIIGNQSTKRFDDATKGDMVDFEVFFKITMESYLSNTWGENNPFPEFYKRLYD
jgi:hypothetical protein